MLRASDAKRLVREAGFELAGIVPALPSPDFGRYLEWAASGAAGEMRYLTDHRSQLRGDPRSLLDSARSILCAGKLYNGPEPYTAQRADPLRAWISRYAWGEDYHAILRSGLEQVAARLKASDPALEYKICVDTAPLLERSYAAAAGLGWIGKNTCLINEARGSWFFLGELLLSAELEPDSAVEERCGTCTRCIDACPTSALTPGRLDSRLCISYLTIELRGPIPEELRPPIGAHVFGCDICQDVCPWNRRAAVTEDPRFTSCHFAPPLERLAALTPAGFRAMFAHAPSRAPAIAGFLRNVAIAMGNSGRPKCGNLSSASPL